MNTQPFKVAGIARVVNNMVTDPLLHEHFSFVTVDLEDTSCDESTYRSVETAFGKEVVGNIPRIPADEMIHSSYDELVQQNDYYIQVYEKIIAEEEIDAVVVNGTYIVPRCLLQAAKRANLPVMTYYHGILTKEISFSDKKDLLPFCEILEKTFISDSDSFIFPSNLTHRLVEKKFGVLHQPHVVIPNGVPESFFEYGEDMIPLGAEKKQVGFVMSRSKVKNKDFVLSFAKENKEKWNVVDIHLISRRIGDKDKKLLDSYGVIIHNEREHSDLPHFFSSLDILLSPSYFETYGNIVQECLACWVPVLVSATMGVCEILRKIGLEGMIYDFHHYSFHSLVEAIDEVVKNNETSYTRLLSDEVALGIVNKKRKQFLETAFHVSRWTLLKSFFYRLVPSSLVK